MKSLVLILVVSVALAQAKIDWSKVTPRHKTVTPIRTAPTPKIVGGQEVEPHGQPYQVAVIGGSGGFCGGSIVKSNVVLTAAHCVDGDTTATIIAGAHNIFEEEPSQQEIQSSKIIVHEKWDPNQISDDIALIILSSHIKLGPTAKAVRLNDDDSIPADEQEALASGWGRYSDASGNLSPILRFVVEKTISNALCKLYFGSYVRSTNVCLDGSNGRGTCQGDSGGPLFVNHDDPAQIGIVSFGSGAGCEAGYPSVFTRVSKYIDWINQNS